MAKPQTPRKPQTHRVQKGTVQAAAPAPQTAPALAQVAQQLQATMAAAQPAPATPAPVTVALRGGMAIAAVRLTNKPYRVGAPHNVAWWQQCTQAIAQGNGSTTVQALLQAGVPAPFVGYVVRRGYMAPVQAAAS